MFRFQDIFLKLLNQWRPSSDVIRHFSETSGALIPAPAQIKSTGSAGSKQHSGQSCHYQTAGVLCCFQDVNLSGFSDLTRFATSAQQVVRSSRQLAAAQVRANRDFIAACIGTLQISKSIAAGRPCNEHFVAIVVKFRLQEMFFS